MTQTLFRFLLNCKKAILIIAFGFGVFIGSVAIQSHINTAYAGCPPCTYCCACCGVQSSCGSDCACTSTRQTEEGTIPWITDEFIIHRTWLVQTVWEGHMLPAMALMTEQLTAAAMYQVLTIGTILDAKHQLETQMLFQKLQAQAHKDYHPSTGVCEFGTNTRSLAAANRNAEFTQIALAARNLQRTLLTGDISTNGPGVDTASRLELFRTTYCNPKDNGNGLEPLCGSGGSDSSRWNKDIDYTRTVDRARSLEVDFSDGGTPKPDEEDLFALGANLYGHKPPMKLNELYLADEQGNPRFTAEDYLDMRALVAKRAVAHNSYAAIAGTRAAGGAEVQPYMEAILKNMGVPEEEIKDRLKEKPSYNAQMELLTKTLYQRPQFYTDLYDKPTNVTRQFTAMKAINNIQKRDMYRSLLRSEAILAIWLELEMEKAAEAVATELEDLDQEGVLQRRPGQ